MRTACVIGLLMAVAIATADLGAQARSDSSSRHPAGAAHRAFVVAVLEHNLPEARSHMSRALIAALPNLGGLAKACADRVGPGGVLGIQTIGTEVEDTRAVVSYRLQLEDGSSRFGKETLVLEDGEWKLDLKEER